jgi:hypothetical protein
MGSYGISRRWLIPRIIGLISDSLFLAPRDNECWRIVRIEIDLALPFVLVGSNLGVECGSLVHDGDIGRLFGLI